MTNSSTNWWIYRGINEPHDGIERLPNPPPWRQYAKRAQQDATFLAEDEEKDLVNAALYLRRPLLITGKPGTGKTSLAYAVARELKLGNVLRWSITTQTTLKDGLYRYDAIARLQDTSLQGDTKTALPVGRYLNLGPLGTAFAASDRPRVLLIDEIDKSDIDLPNNLLHIFEEGEFEIPELARLRKEQEIIEILPYDAEEGTPGIPIKGGKVHCTHFPLVAMTSNEEREFPPAFLRRCLRLPMKPPSPEKLERIVDLHMQELYREINKGDVEKIKGLTRDLITDYCERRQAARGNLATDQLLNAVYLCLKDIDPRSRERKQLLDALWKALSGPES
jgi:MoxR-like ATPase